MILCACMVQEGQIGSEIRQKLERELSSIVANHFSEEVAIGWFDVAKGSGFTAGAPSRSSIVSLQAPSVPQDKRTEVLTAVCDAWSRETGCHVNDVVATVMDRPN